MPRLQHILLFEVQSAHMHPSGTYDLAVLGLEHLLFSPPRVIDCHLNVVKVSYKGVSALLLVCARCYCTSNTTVCNGTA